MKKYLNWIGGGVGWALGGPMGAILGYALGSMFSKTAVAGQAGQIAGRRPRTTADDFVASLLVLSAAVMKADGKVLKSELDFVKKFMTNQFGASVAQDQMILLRNILKQPLPLRQVCTQIRSNMDHPLRLQLVHYVFGIANADGHLASSEVHVIEEIARYLGISAKDYQSIRAMFGQDADNAYKILEIEKSATESEIKKAYRKMALKYHPDKLSGLGVEIKKEGKNKFIKVQEAYEAIKKERNIK